MNRPEIVTTTLQGMYHDVLRNDQGQVIVDRGWKHNTIVIDCRRLLAGFMRGATATLGIQGLQIGAGSPSWDLAGIPPASSDRTSLVDPNPYVVPRSSLQIDYLMPTGDSVSGTPTNRIKILAVLGASVPNWPNAQHPTASLREFGLFGQLDGTPVLINYVAHPVINKDPTSTLERTVWLVF